MRCVVFKRKTNANQREAISTKAQTETPDDVPDDTGQATRTPLVAALLGATALNQVATQTRLNIKKWSLALQPEPGLFTCPSSRRRRDFPQQASCSLPPTIRFQPALILIPEVT